MASKRSWTRFSGPLSGVGGFFVGYLARMRRESRGNICAVPDGKAAGSASDLLAVLAYESARDRLKSQDGTLTNLRNRATTLLSSAAVLTSVAAAVGLVYTDPAKGPALDAWASWILMGLVTLNGLCAMYIVWPFFFTFVPSPAELLELRKQPGITDTEARIAMVGNIAAARARNDRPLNRRVQAFRLQICSLIVEVVALVVALMHTRS